MACGGQAVGGEEACGSAQSARPFMYLTKYLSNIYLLVCRARRRGSSLDGTIEIPPLQPCIPLSRIASGRLDRSRDMSDKTRTEGYLGEGSSKWRGF